MPWGLGNRRRRCTQLADCQGQGADHQEAGLASGRPAGRSALRARRRLLGLGARVHSPPHTVCTQRHAHLHALSSHAHIRVLSCTLPRIRACTPHVRFHTLSSHAHIYVLSCTLTHTHTHARSCTRAHTGPHTCSCPACSLHSHTHTHTHTHTHMGEHGCGDTSASGVRGQRPRSWRKHPLGVSTAHKSLLCCRKKAGGVQRAGPTRRMRCAGQRPVSGGAVGVRGRWVFPVLLVPV